jgi:hypothetical protein
MPEDLEAIKKHIDEKFMYHESLDTLRSQRVDELLVTQTAALTKVSDATTRAHKRIDEIHLKHEILDAQLNTIRVMGLTVSGGIATGLAWLGFTK